MNNDPVCAECGQGLTEGKLLIYARLGRKYSRWLCEAHTPVHELRFYRQEVGYACVPQVKAETKE